ncbi:glycosyltransferase [Synoicihabitans lomoniglobus]|uniref:Glycosyltransferase n=1 Tax=Synoicihabitans lomoniglobus TaxID=2909285 RepID=A0AAF0CSZ8_9BACT|nr:glycosyltransferase [Opitutaceae bacterium LMO-M01]WED67386.1 glycosyltransferase [Opitutaceae bacterium LMO-M01]
MNENESYLFHIEQPTDWRLKPDHFWIYGWFVPKNNVVYTDVRAFIDDVPFTGLLGLPRPDIEHAYSGWTKGRAPGFAFRLEPWAGAKCIRLEIMNRDNEWAEFWRVDINVVGKGECTRHQPSLPPDLIEALYLRLLKHPALHPGASIADHARRMVQDYSIKCVDVLPNPPFRGQFEQPQLIAHTQYNKLSILGWLFHEERQICRLLATTDGNNYNELQHGIAREDVARKYSAFPQAKKPRFQGIIDINQIAANPIPIQIFAEFEDGTRELVFAKRVFQWTCLEKESRLPPFDEGHFLHVKDSIVNACKQLNVNAGGLRFWSETRRLRKLYEEESQDPLPWYDWQIRSTYDSWLSNNQLRPRLRAEFEKSVAYLEANDGPKFSLLLDSRRASLAQLDRLAQSLHTQIYPRWQLMVVIRADADQALTTHVIKLGSVDTRVSYFHGQPGEDFATTLNHAVGAADGDWFMFPPAHGRFAPEGLLLLAEPAASPDYDVVFADEDHMDAAGKRSAPIFKPAWSPELIYSGTHPGECFSLRRRTFEATQGFESKFDPLLNFALTLRLQDTVKLERAAHVAAIAYHRDHQVSSRIGDSDRTELMKAAVNAALARRQQPGQAFQPPFAVNAGLPDHQIYWKSSYLADNPVTIVIPTRDRSDLLERCIEALLQTVNWAHVKLVIVDDFSREEKTVRFLKCLAERQDFSCRVVRPDVDPMRPFNYSRLVNAALSYIDTPLILHLNNDVDALKPGWIEEMAGWFSDPGIGVVGARLLYANDHINHAGVIVGPHHGLADVPLAGLGPTEDAPYGLHKLARNCSAVTGACLMTRTDLYKEHRGFDEETLGVSYNDVDYCLRLKKAGFRTVYTPQAELWHWGSASRGTDYHPEEHIAFAKRYENFIDPYWSRFLKPENRNVSIDVYRYAQTKRLDKLHLLAVSHNLNFEGAPLFLFEYIKFLVNNLGFKVDIVAAEEGPLRAAYEAMGAEIILVDRHPLHGARNDTEFAEQLEVMQHELAQQIDLRPIDAFVCNTIACWWGVHLAAAVNKPSMLYIHESATLKRFFSGALPKKRHGVARAAFRLATRVFFLCKSTRAFYEELNDYDNFRYVTSWIDLPRIEALKTATPRDIARAKLGYAPHEQVVANIGTVCERKGQHIFVRTVAYFMKHFAANGSYRFLLVGGRPGEYQDSLIKDIARLGLSDVIEIVHETDRVYEYFRAANIFACTSFEESFPRVLLEAMAFETPIVSTNVHGIPEMVTDKAEAYLVPPGDPIVFAKTLKTCLDKLLHGTSTVPMGYSKVVRAYDMRNVLPKHADLAREAVLDYDRNPKRSSPRRRSGRGDRVESSW